MQQISENRVQYLGRLVGNVIHWELCKKLKFDLTTKWYMHKTESVQENETLLWEFEIQTDHIISARGQVGDLRRE